LKRKSLATGHRGAAQGKRLGQKEGSREQEEKRERKRGVGAVRLDLRLGRGQASRTTHVRLTTICYPSLIGPDDACRKRTTGSARTTVKMKEVVDVILAIQGRNNHGGEVGRRGGWSHGQSTEIWKSNRKVGVRTERARYARLIAKTGRPAT